MLNNVNDTQSWDVRCETSNGILQTCDIKRETTDVKREIILLNNSASNADIRHKNTKKDTKPTKRKTLGFYASPLHESTTR